MGEFTQKAKGGTRSTRAVPVTQRPAPGRAAGPAPLQAVSPAFGLAAPVQAKLAAAPDAALQRQAEEEEPLQQQALPEEEEPGV